MLLAQTVDYTTSSTDTAAAGIGLIFVLIFGVIGFAIFVWEILAIIDTTKYPDSAWAASGQNKQTALIITILSLFTCFLLTAFYWFGIRPKVRAAANMG